MAKIKITSVEFPNIIAAYLLDMMIHSDEESGNVLFDELIDDFQRKGMFPILLRYFRAMDPNHRVKYKFIKKGISPYDDENENTVIQVIPGDKKEE